jgi:3-oxoacyl-[acyl-carrier-protein] synthase II
VNDPGEPRREVVVTGLGVVSPLGATAAEHWTGLLAGRSSVTAMTYPWARELPARIAAPVTLDLDASLSRTEVRRNDRVQKLALIAGRQAWADAGLGTAEVAAERIAVCVGTAVGGLGSVLEQAQALLDGGFRAVSPALVIRAMASGPAAVVGIDLGARAGVHSVSSACASGTEAIARGAEIIRAGGADVVVAGGAEAAITPLGIAGFAAMRALSTRNDDPSRASRPWDKARDGFVMGEGAGMLVLEEERHAVARGATCYARLAGAGVSADGQDMVKPPADGQGLARAIGRALRESGLSPHDIAHVNAHATGTPVGDLAEAEAIRSAIGEHPVVTANKSMTGHLLGGAGAVEAAATVLAVRNGLVPPTMNLDDLDGRVRLDVVVGTPRRLDVPAAVKTSTGFGGHNVALVYTRL